MNLTRVLIALILALSVHESFSRSIQTGVNLKYEEQFNGSMFAWQSAAQEIPLTTRTQVFRGKDPDEVRLIKLQIVDSCLVFAEDLADSAAHLKNLVDRFGPSEAELDDFRGYSLKQIENVREFARSIREQRDLDLIDGRSKTKKGSRSEAENHPELLTLVQDLDKRSARVKTVLLEARKRLKYPVVSPGEVNIVSHIEPSLDSQLKELDRVAQIVEKSIQSYQP